MLGPHSRLDIGRLIGYGSTGHVYSAVLDGQHPVVIKLVLPLSSADCASVVDAIRSESHAYETMDNLRGNAVPRFYGLWSNLVGNGQVAIPMLALVLEDVGKGLDTLYPSPQSLMYEHR